MVFYSNSIVIIKVKMTMNDGRSLNDSLANDNVIIQQMQNKNLAIN